MGIDLAGYLPECTSLMQSLDVGIFMTYKAIRIQIESEQRRTGVKINRVSKVEAGMKALSRTLGNRNLVLSAVRKAGMHPIDRNVHLRNSLAQQADVLRASHDRAAATTLVSALEAHGSSSALTHSQAELQQLSPPCSPIPLLESPAPASILKKKV